MRCTSNTAVTGTKWSCTECSAINAVVLVTGSAEHGIFERRGSGAHHMFTRTLHDLASHRREGSRLLDDGVGLAGWSRGRGTRVGRGRSYFAQQAECRCLHIPRAIRRRLFIPMRKSAPSTDSKISTSEPMKNRRSETTARRRGRSSTCSANAST